MEKNEKNPCYGEKFEEFSQFRVKNLSEKIEKIFKKKDFLESAKILDDVVIEVLGNFLNNFFKFSWKFFGEKKIQKKFFENFSENLLIL